MILTRVSNVVFNMTSSAAQKNDAIAKRAAYGMTALVSGRTIAFHKAAMPEPLFRAGPSFDELIVAIGMRQDRSAFAAVFAHFAPRVKAYLMRTGSDPMSADELTQEVMLLVWRKAVHYNPAQANAATWIFTIARNKRIDRYRRERHVDFNADDPAFAPEPEVLPDHRLQATQQAHAINNAISRLPHEQAALLRLAFYESKSHSVIAAEVGLPLGTVKSRLRLALARLRGYLGGEV